MRAWRRAASSGPEREALTQRPYTDPQSIPLLIITERGANEENNDQRLKLNNPLDEGAVHTV